MAIPKICPLKSFSRHKIKEKVVPAGKMPYYQKNIHVCRKIAYGFGGPPMQMLSNALGFFLPIFLLETAKISPYYLSVIQIIARIWDAVTDPVTGYLVSRTKSRFGKFKPWMFFATPVSCVAFFMQFYVPHFQSEAAKFAFYCIAILLLQTGLTAFHVPYSSMCMVLTSNPHDRDQLVSIRMAFEIIGVLFGAGVFGGIATLNRVASKPNGTNITEQMFITEKRDYMFASIAVCIIFIICSVTVLLGTSEKEILKDEERPYLPNFKKIIYFKPYLFIMFAFMFTSLGIQLVQSNLALYITHTLHIPKHVTPGILVLLICAFLLVPVGHKLLKRFGKKKIFFAGIINIIPILTSLAFLPQNLNLIIFYALMVWTSFTVMVALVLPWSMLPNVIDLFMIENGFRMESTFYSFYVFFNKFAVGISLFISSIALGLAGYDTKLNIQPQSVSDTLRYYIGSSGILCFLISMIFLYFYPINEEKSKEITMKLEEMRKNFLSSKMMNVPTYESELDINCDKNDPTEKQLREANLAAENLVRNAHADNVDFVIGSEHNLRKV